MSNISDQQNTIHQRAEDKIDEGEVDDKEGEDTDEQTTLIKTYELESLSRSDESAGEDEAFAKTVYQRP